MSISIFIILSGLALGFTYNYRGCIKKFTARAIKSIQSALSTDYSHRIERKAEKLGKEDPKFNLDCWHNTFHYLVKGEDDRCKRVIDYKDIIVVNVNPFAESLYAWHSEDLTHEAYSSKQIVEFEMKDITSFCIWNEPWGSYTTVNNRSFTIISHSKQELMDAIYKFCELREKRLGKDDNIDEYFHHNLVFPGINDDPLEGDAHNLLTSKTKLQAYFICGVPRDKDSWGVNSYYDDIYKRTVENLGFISKFSAKRFSAKKFDAKKFDGEFLYDLEIERKKRFNWVKYTDETKSMYRDLDSSEFKSTKWIDHVISITSVPLEDSGEQDRLEKLEKERMLLETSKQNLIFGF